jgi:hypothetical protein
VPKVIGVGRTCLKVFGPVAAEPQDMSAAEDPQEPCTAEIQRRTSTAASEKGKLIPSQACGVARPVICRVHEAKTILHELMPQMRGHLSWTILNPQPLDAFRPLPWDAADLDGCGTEARVRPGNPR